MNHLKIFRAGFGFVSLWDEWKLKHSKKPKHNLQQAENSWEFKKFHRWIMKTFTFSRNQFADQWRFHGKSSEYFPYFYNLISVAFNENWKVPSSYCEKFSWPTDGIFLSLNENIFMRNNHSIPWLLQKARKLYHYVCRT